MMLLLRGIRFPISGWQQWQHVDYILHLLPNSIAILSPAQKSEALASASTHADQNILALRSSSSFCCATLAFPGRNMMFRCRSWRRTKHFLLLSNSKLTNYFTSAKPCSAPPYFMLECYCAEPRSMRIAWVLESIIRIQCKYASRL